MPIRPDSVKIVPGSLQRGVRRMGQLSFVENFNYSNGELDSVSGSLWTKRDVANVDADVTSNLLIGSAESTGSGYNSGDKADYNYIDSFLINAELQRIYTFTYSLTNSDTAGALTTAGLYIEMESPTAQGTAANAVYMRLRKTLGNVDYELSVHIRKLAGVVSEVISLTPIVDPLLNVTETGVVVCTVDGTGNANVKVNGMLRTPTQVFSAVGSKTVRPRLFCSSPPVDPLALAKIDSIVYTGTLA